MRKLLVIAIISMLPLTVFAKKLVATGLVETIEEVTYLYVEQEGSEEYTVYTVKDGKHLNALKAYDGNISFTGDVESTDEDDFIDIVSYKKIADEADQ